MKRGISRRGTSYRAPPPPPHHQHHQSDQTTSTLRPLHHHDHNTTTLVVVQPHQSSDSQLHAPSTSNHTEQPSSFSPEIAIPSSSDFSPKTRRPSRNRRNPRNRINKTQFVIVKKQEPGPSDSSQEGISKTKEEEDEDEEHDDDDNDHSRNGCEFNSKKDGETVDDVASRLEKLRLSSRDEPELSEELLRINDQLQEDELLAMESIYGDNIYILDKQNGIRSFQIHVHIEALKEIIISTKLNSVAEVDTNTNGSNEFTYSFEVQYLPPIVLTCLLPKSYPSHLPPYFTISVQWLDASKISSLCSMLDSIWNEQRGQEIIYPWAEWLQSSSLSYLGFHEEIMLGPYGVNHSEDLRAISGCGSPDICIPLLKSYNDEQRHENFRKSFHECCICFSEFAGVDFIRLPCQHFFCQKCMKTYSDMLIKEGTVSKLLCPNTKCGGMIPPGLLKRLLGDEEFERWESLTLQNTLELMSDVAYCPRCETACIEDEDQHAQCSNCFYSFCTLCRDRRHVGTACVPADMKLQILQARQSSSQLPDGQRQREQQMIQELISVREILRDAKQCPSCRMAISRTEGCNKMVCNNCGQYFCYRCSKAITGYEHFRDGSCELFPQEEVQRWEHQMNPRQAIGQIQAELFADRGHLCPTCGQVNVKVGNNNHIFCWACQKHYCYLCRKIVKRSSQHFGPKGCKQHTIG